MQTKYTFMDDSQLRLFTYKVSRKVLDHIPAILNTVSSLSGVMFIYFGGVEKKNVSSCQIHFISLRESLVVDWQKFLKPVELGV
jgi:hypothetical protein